MTAELPEFATVAEATAEVQRLRALVAANPVLGREPGTPSPPPWRTGGKVFKTVYDGTPGNLIGSFMRREDAELAVEAVNGHQERLEEACILAGIVGTHLGIDPEVAILHCRAQKLFIGDGDVPAREAFRRAVHARWEQLMLDRVMANPP